MPLSAGGSSGRSAGGTDGKRHVGFAADPDSPDRRPSIEYESALDISGIASTFPIRSPVLPLAALSPEGVTLTAQVIGFELAKDSKDGSTFATYLVEARLHDEPYVVRRRYQMFVELRRQVRGVLFMQIPAFSCGCSNARHVLIDCAVFPCCAPAACPPVPEIEHTANQLHHDIWQKP